ncbi:hypothetical protein Taro_009309 [Colocasia esculenta]|uniref:Uncharacterized protein n=1 Tax=Colocasia esculenta TaxID=4460 RepID=A0A843U4J8_COLES|nr:hypothetical protein [Colocasia esculenta]
MGGCSLRNWLQKDAYIVLGKGGGRGGRKHPSGAGFGNPKSEVSVGCRQAVCICRQMHSGIENLSSVLGCLCVSVDRKTWGFQGVIPFMLKEDLEGSRVLYSSSGCEEKTSCGWVCKCP